MSKAGIQSNRGDGYQTLVAFGWALYVLSDPDYQWIEVDSVKWSVDDVVIGRADGRKICCQCKKNQADHKAWSIADLADELAKAIALLANDCTVEVRFYSRSAFGDLSALKELSVNYADEATYQLNLGTKHRRSDAALKRLIEQTRVSLSTYEFLCRTTFEVSPELDQMSALLHERLRILASKPTAAFDALWRRLDQLGMRTSNQGLSTAVRHRLDSADLKGLLTQAGAMLTPPMNAVEVRASFKGTSAIGRAWRRDVGNERISSPVVEDLLAAIEAKASSILLSGLPGSGKTCVMLAVQEELERRAQASSDLLPLFIQAREFADMATAQDRQTQGLSELWVESVARMAEDSHVVVIIDSLDVLSIAREHVVLTYFLAQIDRLLLISNVTVVTACRDFDRHYDRRIAQRTWAKEFACQPLNWEADIVPLLARLGIDTTTIDSTTRALIRNPRELALFAELAQRRGSFNVVTRTVRAIIGT
ncbi:AAA family ATPase [Paucibacter sediminis]|uniref:AAA family ATPase n=1 Tax=Paucibacter sediminis TaxID=3019553 RepID=A0AA95NBF8_9BURK|nr:AAA family ATPase [Paucibacter sp. S2-9]WIT11952.1 AAA family ATPase [Paucibacter sp. S2-9]